MTNDQPSGSFPFFSPWLLLYSISVWLELLVKPAALTCNVQSPPFCRFQLHKPFWDELRCFEIFRDVVWCCTMLYDVMKSFEMGWRLKKKLRITKCKSLLHSVTYCNFIRPNPKQGLIRQQLLIMFLKYMLWSRPEWTTTSNELQWIAVCTGLTTSVLLHMKFTAHR